MSNRFKFRAMIDGKIKNLEGFVGCSLDYFFEMNSKESHVMQSTGLKDKNGVDIFEDDIVKRTSIAVGVHDTVGIVKNLEGCWVIDSGNDAFKLWTESDLNEVIGNIHDNPELLINEVEEK